MSFSIEKQQKTSNFQPKLVYLIFIPHKLNEWPSLRSCKANDALNNMGPVVRNYPCC